VARIAVLDDYEQTAFASADWGPLVGHDVVVFPDHVGEPEALVERVASFDIVVAMRERSRFSRAVLAALPKLRLLVTTGTRNAAIDLDAAQALGVTVCGTGGLANGTPELTWGLIIGLARQLVPADTAVRAGAWAQPAGVDLAGRTLGVVGLGRLGARVARVGQAFDMDVVAWSPHLTEERCAERGVRLATKDELFRTADVVTLHLVLSAATSGVVGREELRAMKPTALFVNTSRGPLVDEAALLTAVTERWIAGAALDVYAEEPLPADHPLRSAPRTLLTPHLGYGTQANLAVFFTDVVQDIVQYLAGAPVRLLTSR
jgi:phosphoglycerate dehydrogenase-like enzyme